jgi:tetratricopeptide (TPR) repeat protein
MLTIFLAVVFAANATWYEHYINGVRLIQQGDGDAARAELEIAVVQHPTEGLQVPTAPQQYIDYTPHLYLAIANQMAGKVTAARKELALAEDSGIAAKSEVGRPLLVAYELLLHGNVVADRRPPYAVYAAKPPVLSEAEFNMLRNDVLSRCELPADTKMQNAPWYANYELGLELERKGDYPRALNHFIEAVAHRPNPQRHARMYGMWLIDYYPYFHIARSHARLENWQCAENAIDISQKLVELPTDAPELDEMVAIQREAQKHINQQ